MMSTRQDILEQYERKRTGLHAAAPEQYATAATAALTSILGLFLEVALDIRQALYDLKERADRDR